MVIGCDRTAGFEAWVFCWSSLGQVVLVMCEVRVPKPRSNREMRGLGSRQAVDVRVGVRFCTVFLSFFTVEGLRLF